MMVMTSVSERPVTEPAGTIGAVVWLGSLRRRERLRGAAFAGLELGRGSGVGPRCVGCYARLRPAEGLVLQRARAAAAASAGLSACHTIRTWPSCSSRRGALVCRIS